MTDEARPELRASDVDRELTAAQLRRHATAGRLTLQELDQRLEWAYAAKTIGDLKKLTSDLPQLSNENVDLTTLTRDDSHASLGERDQRREQRHVRRAARRGPPAWLGSRAMWGSYLSVNLMLIVIWLLSSATSDGGWYPWWLWVAGPWGAALLANEITRRTHGDRSIES